MIKKATSEPVLLDVNVLLALAWPNRQFHVAARARMAASGIVWATPALTELACGRLLTFGHRLAYLRGGGSAEILEV